jgi:hypothetical protein
VKQESVTKPDQLIRVIKPAKHLDEHRVSKYYVGRFYFVWTREECELRKKCRTATEAEWYSRIVLARFLRMNVPEESRQ